jgi:hypothetical protein
MVERYIKTFEEHLRKVVASHEREWDEKLPLFLLAYSATTHVTTGLAPASLAFRRKLCPAICFSDHPQTRDDPRQNMQQT